MTEARSNDLSPAVEGPPKPQDCGANGKQRSRAELPRALRKEIFQFARKLKKHYRQLFASDPIYRKRAGQFLTALLPPKPRRRGRPGRADVTQAIRLRRQFRRQFPDEPWAKTWERIYPLAIPNYATMAELEQADARQELRERVRWRQRDRSCSRNTTNHIRMDAKRKALEGIVQKPQLAPQDRSENPRPFPRAVF